MNDCFIGIIDVTVRLISHTHIDLFDTDWPRRSLFFEDILDLLLKFFPIIGKVLIVFIKILV